MQRVPFAERSSFYAPIADTLKTESAALDDGARVEVDLGRGGYPGDVLLSIEAGNGRTFLTDWTGADPTRFPARIKAAATALRDTVGAGTYRVRHEDGTLALERSQVRGRPEGQTEPSPATATEALDLLTRPQLLDAADAIDRGAETAFADSRDYVVVHEGREYAPLHLVGVAAAPLLGRQLLPHSAEGPRWAKIKGGLGTSAFRALKRCGFEVVQRGPESGIPRPADARPVRHWALAADPRTYRIEDAVREIRGPDLWTTRGRDIREGDRVVIWRTSGGGGPRGVVALGEVVGPVQLVSDADNPYWQDSDDSVGPRVPVRYVVPPGLPLYLGNDGDGPARALSVARARGGTVFNVSADEWDALVGAAGGFEGPLRQAEEDAEEARIASSDLPMTEKDQLVRARRGQGVFRRRVEAVETGCRMTGTTDRSLLVASHIKPWRVSSDTERLDGHNGLLLAPHVDRLFDGGRISFEADGRVLVASPSVRAEMARWGLDPDARVGPFTERQSRYLAHHRAEVFGA